MPQCKAQTANGTQCASQVVAPSRTLCKRHQNTLASGKPVINAETGRKFPATATAATAKVAPAMKAAPPAKAATRRAGAASAAATPRARAARAASAAAAAPRAGAAPRPRGARAAAAATTASASPSFSASTATLDRKRGPGEHSLHCGGPGCTNMSLPGSDYCMQHQNLA